MRSFKRITLISRITLIGAFGFSVGTSAVAGDGGLTITISNDSTSNLLVTVYDLNTAPAQKILASQVINGFAAVSVSVTADDSGHGHLSWSATTQDRDMRQCGHRDKPDLNDGDTVHVTADDTCG
jgi:hypothetical protein